jgi:hypothetical protein
MIDPYLNLQEVNELFRAGYLSSDEMRRLAERFQADHSLLCCYRFDGDKISAAFHAKRVPGCIKCKGIVSEE